MLVIDSAHRRVSKHEDYKYVYQSVCLVDWQCIHRSISYWLYVMIDIEYMHVYMWHAPVSDPTSSGERMCIDDTQGSIGYWDTYVCEIFHVRVSLIDNTQKEAPNIEIYIYI